MTAVLSSPIRVVGAVLRQAVQGSGFRYLLARRRGTDLWEFPGGKVEPGEPDERALERELLEELGLAIVVREKVAELVERAAVQDPRDPVERRICLVCFYAEPVGAMIPLDHDRLCWRDLQEALNLKMGPADARMLREHLLGLFPPSVGDEASSPSVLPALGRVALPEPAGPALWDSDSAEELVEPQNML